MEKKNTSELIGKSAEEIVEIFNGYNFVDGHGHRLDTCQEFIDLVGMAIGSQSSLHKTEVNIVNHNVQGPLFF
ncbi:TPA: hypothetical protein MIG29_03315 [Klebsiella pneumoniae]|nr:hypothetical protein [Klebsiella pneumoniae]